MAMSRGKRIRKLLSERQMTARDLAKKVGTSEVSMSRYIHDERIPRSDMLAKIAIALGTSMDYLELGEERTWTKRPKNWSD